MRAYHHYHTLCALDFIVYGALMIFVVGSGQV